jgi:ribonuclease D
VFSYGVEIFALLKKKIIKMKKNKITKHNSVKSPKVMELQALRNIPHTIKEAGDENLQIFKKARRWERKSENEQIKPVLLPITI